MKEQATKRGSRCAIYARVSTDQGLEQDFNSLDAQRESSEAYIKSQAHEGWRLIRERYDDGGFSGGSMERPALQKLLSDVQARRIDVIVVYKVDRLTRSLADFAKLVELFDANNVSFVSVTQSRPAPGRRPKPFTFCDIHGCRSWPPGSCAAGWRNSIAITAAVARPTIIDRHDSIGNHCGVNSPQGLFKQLCLPLAQADRSLPP
jgi:Resolvase, N terminal domain